MVCFELNFLLKGSVHGAESVVFVSFQFDTAMNFREKMQSAFFLSVNLILNWNIKIWIIYGRNKSNCAQMRIPEVFTNISTTYVTMHIFASPKINQTKISHSRMYTLMRKVMGSLVLIFSQAVIWEQIGPCQWNHNVYPVFTQSTFRIMRFILLSSRGHFEFQ